MRWRRWEWPRNSGLECKLLGCVVRRKKLPSQEVLAVAEKLVALIEAGSEEIWVDGSETASVDIYVTNFHDIRLRWHLIDGSERAQRVV